MSIATSPLTYKDLEQFPNDGKRYEIIGGELYVSPAPLKRHQRLLRRLTVLFDALAAETGVGEVFFAPVDVRFSDHDQVQPDLIFILHERRHIYRGNTVFEPPDLVIEVVSPSNRLYDERVKMQLYAEAGVPEFWLADPQTPAIRPYLLRDGRYVPIEPDDGRLHSAIVPGLIVDPATLLAGLDD